MLFADALTARQYQNRFLVHADGLRVVLLNAGAVHACLTDMTHEDLSALFKFQDHHGLVADDQDIGPDTGICFSASRSGLMSGQDIFKNHIQSTEFVS